MSTRIMFGLVAIAAFVAACGSSPSKIAMATDVQIADSQLGLSKTSVEDVPVPDVFTYSTTDPGTNERAERSYMTAPPMITHSIQDMVPIHQDSNLCKDCHVQPDLIGKPVEKGMPIPAPRSHYVANTDDLYMGRWNCIQCHAPQANVKLLVESTFVKDQ